MSETPSPATTEAIPAARPRRAYGALVWLGAAALAFALAFVLWHSGAAGREQQQRTQAELQQLSTRVESALRGAEAARRETDTLRARLDDAAKVNAALREQLLGLTERARLVEDSVANLAGKRMSGHDALLLNETEMLLVLGTERYTLFHDAAAAIDAYRLADGALAAVDDAAFSTVRQSITAEIEAFTVLAGADPASALSALAVLRTGSAQLPPAARGLGAVPAQASQSRWQQLLGQFVRVRRSDDAVPVQRRDVALARQLYALDLRDAEAALLARDATRWHAALADTRELLKADFDPNADAVKAALATLEGLDLLALAPPPPKILGAALKDLRSVRATHALRETSQAPAKPQSEVRTP